MLCHIDHIKATAPAAITPSRPPARARATPWQRPELPGGSRDHGHARSPGEGKYMHSKLPVVVQSSDMYRRLGEGSRGDMPACEVRVIPAAGVLSHGIIISRLLIWSTRRLVSPARARAGSQRLRQCPIDRSLSIPTARALASRYDKWKFSRGTSVLGMDLVRVWTFGWCAP